MSQVRNDFSWLTPDASVVIANKTGELEWWTFAGQRANGSLITALAQAARARITVDSLAIRFEPHVSLNDVDKAIEEIRAHDVAELLPTIDEAAIDGLKFSECLPTELALHLLRMRSRDEAGVRQLLREPVRFVSD
jgi:ATP-dependent Lhr-like helicase